MQMQTMATCSLVHHLSVAYASGSLKKQQQTAMINIRIFSGLVFPARKKQENAKSIGERVVGDGDRSLTLRAGSVGDGQIKLPPKIRK